MILLLLPLQYKTCFPSSLRYHRSMSFPNISSPTLDELSPIPSIPTPFLPDLRRSLVLPTLDSPSYVQPPSLSGSLPRSLRDVITKPHPSARIPTPPHLYTVIIHVGEGPLLGAVKIQKMCLSVQDEDGRCGRWKRKAEIQKGFLGRGLRRQ